MKTRPILSGLVLGVCGALVACAADSPPPANSPQPIVPGSQATYGVTEEQAITDEEVVNELADAKCDQRQSCNRIGPGATYRDRADCVAQMSRVLRTEVNAARCEGGIGESGLAQCVKSIHLAECDMPGELVGGASHCKLNALCIRRPTGATP